MKTTADYLDAVAARLGGVSDYRVAMTLGISTQAVSRWRTGKDSIGDDAAIKVAAILECDPAEILMSTAAERSKSSDVRDAWQHALEKLRGVAAALALLCFSVFSQVRPAEANNAHVLKKCEDGLYYVKSVGRHAGRIAGRLRRVITKVISASSFPPLMPLSFFRPRSAGME